jgi:RluA family pseudouridine synthase
MKSGPALAAKRRMLTPGNPPLWADAHLLVVDKPAGLRVIPDGYDSKLPTLVGLLQLEWGKLWVVHRLDKDTSGVMVFARSADAHRALNQQFADHSVGKIYHALAAGSPDWEHKTVALPLRVNGDRGHRTVIDTHHGKLARTDLAVLRRFPLFCLMEAKPHTGYTHQIRAHLAACGLPIMGDPLYQYPPSWTGPKLDLKALPPIQRTALHALSIHFAHPETGQEMSFSSPYPVDFQSLFI